MLSRTLALLAHSARRFRPLVLAFGAVLAGFQLLLALAAKAIQESDLFGRIATLMPDFVRQALGPAAISVMSFAGVISIGYFHMAVVAVLVGVAVAVATEAASEIESGFLDLVLAHPVTRLSLTLRTAALLAGCTVVLIGAMLAGTLVGAYWLARDDAGQIFTTACRLASNLAVLVFCWGAVAFALTSFARRRSTPALIAGLLAFSSYVVDYLAGVWRPASRVAWLSPFHYYTTASIIAGAAPPARDLLILACAAVAGIAVGALQLARRDL